MASQILMADTTYSPRDLLRSIPRYRSLASSPLCHLSAHSRLLYTNKHPAFDHLVQCWRRCPRLRHVHQDQAPAILHGRRFEHCRSCLRCGIAAARLDGVYFAGRACGGRCEEEMLDSLYIFASAEHVRKSDRLSDDGNPSNHE